MRGRLCCAEKRRLASLRLPRSNLGQRAAFVIRSCTDPIASGLERGLSDTAMNTRIPVVLLLVLVAGGTALDLPRAGADTPESSYGRELALVKDIGIGPAMAAEVAGDKLYVIGRGKLHVADISNPAGPKILGSLAGLGNTRQIKVARNIAFITARENGVFIVDVRDPAAPRLLCHYDSIEVATGVDVSGDVLFVACRLHGVELVDVSNPEKPRHLSAVRTGEAQSVAVRNGYAYTGVWGTSELVVVDVKNPREPNITARCPLDGFGDGVAVRGNHVFVATGHHSRVQPRAKEGDPGFGRGHGLEIFDISDPAKPVFVSRVKNPVFYRIGEDMWGVKVAGDHAFVADTYNGIFVVNVADPARPYFVAHKRLPVVQETGLPGYVGGLALAGDVIYVAGGRTDLHVVAAPGLAKPCAPEPDAPPLIPPAAPRPNPDFRVYQTDGQVRAVDFAGDIAFVAAGSDGLHVVQVWPDFKRLNRYETQGFAMDVRVSGDFVYVAEDKGGLSIWRRSADAKLVPAGRYQPNGRNVREVAIPPPGKYALLLVQLSRLDIVDVANPAAPRSVFRDEGKGFLYQLAEELIEKRYVCALWQLGGLVWYDLYGGPTPAPTGERYAFRLGHGAAAAGRNILASFEDGLIFLDSPESRPPAELKVYRGQKYMAGCNLYRLADGLYMVNRATGEIYVLDIADPRAPRLLERRTLPGNPGRLVLHNQTLVIPNGYEGLWVEKKVRR